MYQPGDIPQEIVDLCSCYVCKAEKRLSFIWFTIMSFTHAYCRECSGCLKGDLPDEDMLRRVTAEYVKRNTDSLAATPAPPLT